MTQAADTVVRREIVVEAPIERAFNCIHRSLRRHQAASTTCSAPITEDDLRARAGGRTHDRAEDGSECRWARIRFYELLRPVVFSWDIGPTWQLEPDPANTSEVEVRFVAEGPDRTRVELEHRHIDRHGLGWDAVYHGVDSDGGWPLYLTRYAALLSP